ncbi:hypothetical protein P9112_011335 [Eukaryota sp. TZLM1-RC]
MNPASCSPVPSPKPSLPKGSVDLSDEDDALSQTITTSSPLSHKSTVSRRKLNEIATRRYSTLSSQTLPVKFLIEDNVEPLYTSVHLSAPDVQLDDPLLKPPSYRDCLLNS